MTINILIQFLFYWPNSHEFFTRALGVGYQTFQIFDFDDPVVAGISNKIRVRSRGQKLVAYKLVNGSVRRWALTYLTQAVLSRQNVLLTGQYWTCWERRR